MALYEGIIEEIFDEVVIKTFHKREIAIREIAPQYPQVRSFIMAKNKCDVLDNFKVGDKVRVEFNMNGSKVSQSNGENKYYNSDVIWKIDKVV